MESIIKTIKEKLKSEKILVACSTGVDSMTLLSLCMQALSKDNIIVAHVNHKKREQSEIEENYIKDFCIKNALKYHILHLEKIKQGNFQAIARAKRYEFFYQIAKEENCKYILLAHHADDNLETILMRLIKSSSLKGYAGIEEESSFKELFLYRPLLKKNKKQIYEYANSKNIKYYEDESNNELDYTRNRIRHLITPILLEENKNLYESIEYFSQTILNANEIIENAEIAFIKNHVSTNNINTQIIKQSEFDKLSLFMKKQILFRILKKHQLSHKCIEEIIKKLNSKKTNIVSPISKNLALIKEYGKVIFTEENLKPLNYFLKIETDGIYNLPNNRKIEVVKNNCYYYTKSGKTCYNIENLPIIIRTRKDADRFASSLLSDYITKQKIPYLLKKDILLLCDETNSVLATLEIEGGKKWQK